MKKNLMLLSGVVILTVGLSACGSSTATRPVAASSHSGAPVSAGGPVSNAPRAGLSSLAVHQIMPDKTSLAGSWDPSWQQTVTNMYYSNQMSYAGADPVSPIRTLYTINYTPTTAQYNQARQYFISQGESPSAPNLAPVNSKVLWVVYQSRTAVSTTGVRGFYGWDFAFSN